MKNIDWKKVCPSVQMCIVLFCMWGAIFGGTAMAVDKVLYDDFSGNYLDSARWSPLESVIKVENGKLVNQLAAKTTDGTGWTGAGQYVDFRESGTIHTIKTIVTLQEVILRNSDTFMAGVQINGQYYKTSDGHCFAELSQ